MRNQKGFSLIEIMIAMGIMSVATMALMQLTVQTMLTSNLADVQSALNSLVTSETGIASNSATCTKAITQTKQPYSTSFQFDALKNGANLNQYFLTVDNVSYNNSSLQATGYDGTKVYYGTLSITTSANKQVLGPKNLAPRPILAIYLTVDPSGIIIACGPAMPTLPQPPTPPAPTEPTPDPSVVHACVTIGGTFVNGSCNIPPATGCDNGKGNNYSNNGKGNCK